MAEDPSLQYKLNYQQRAMLARFGISEKDAKDVIGIMQEVENQLRDFVVTILAERAKQGHDVQAFIIRAMLRVMKELTENAPLPAKVMALPLLTSGFDDIIEPMVAEIEARI